MLLLSGEQNRLRRTTRQVSRLADTLHSREKSRLVMASKRVGQQYSLFRLRQLSYQNQFKYVCLRNSDRLKYQVMRELAGGALLVRRRFTRGRV